jgi:hypothetical protein
VEAGARVCPFCGEPPGTGVFCAACGRNLGQVEQLPTREAWERGRDAGADPVAAFLAAMHAAGDPGVAKLPRTEPGFLGRTQHARGWVVGAGLFVTVDGRLHRLGRTTRGVSYKGPVYADVVGPEVDGAGEELAADLAAVLRANGIDDVNTA